MKGCTGRFYSLLPTLSISEKNNVTHLSTNHFLASPFKIHLDMGTTSATWLFNLYHQDAPHKIVKNDVWPILTRFLVIYACVSSFKLLPIFGTCWPSQNCHPPSCAQNVLSLLRRATGTDKKGNQPSLEAKIFLKCCYKSQSRDIFASLDQSSLDIRSIMQKINSGE